MLHNLKYGLCTGACLRAAAQSWGQTGLGPVSHAFPPGLAYTVSTNIINHLILSLTNSEDVYNLFDVLSRMLGYQNHL